MFNDEKLNPLLVSGTVPRKPQLLNFLKTNKLSLPDGYTWTDMRDKFKMKIKNNKLKAENDRKRQENPTEKKRARKESKDTNRPVKKSKKN